MAKPSASTGISRNARVGNRAGFAFVTPEDGIDLFLPIEVRSFGGSKVAIHDIASSLELGLAYPELALHELCKFTEAGMTKGEELYASIKAIRDFLGDIGQMLVSGDALMAKHAWEVVGDAGCLHGLSYSVYQGRLWMPGVAFRRYANKSGFPFIVAMISVLLADEELPLTEPAIAGTVFSFPENMNPDQIWIDPWNAKWAGWRKAPLDGKPICIDHTDGAWKKKWNWRQVQAFARPLVDVTSQDALQGLIVDPLLGLIQTPVSESTQ